jgi:CspA family cold shock protein
MSHRHFEPSGDRGVARSRYIPPPTHDPVEGTVRWFDSAEGWGIIDAPEVPGDCFVHVAHVRHRGDRVVLGDSPGTFTPPLRRLFAGHRVTFSFEGPLKGKQDGCDYRAIEVYPGTD